MTEKVHYGKFEVEALHASGFERYEELRHAQEGCAVLEVQWQDYRRKIVVIAEHPDFDEIDLGMMEVPTYDVIFGINPDGSRYRRFKRRQG